MHPPPALRVPDTTTEEALSVDESRRQWTRVCTAAVMLAVLFCGAAEAGAQAGGERATGTHVVVGVEPVSSFDVAIGGEAVPGSPVASSSIGLLSFEVDDAGLPPGSNAVIISQNGDLVIGGVAANQVTTSSAVITWSTNQPASSRVDYGTTLAYGSSSPDDPTLVTSHSVTLTGLGAGTPYYFRVASEDVGGGSAESGGHTFETDPATLIISNVAVTNVSWGSARIRWTTDRPASSQVLYGETGAYGEDSGTDLILVTTHDVFITGLTEDTDYHYVVVSVDANQNSTQSADATFTTAVIPLVVFEVAVTAGVDSAVVTWRTNKPSDTRVEYGLTDAYGSETTLKTAFVDVHSDTLRGLTPGQTYHFRARSAAGGAPAYSVDTAFQTEVGPLLITDVNADAEVVASTISWVTNRVADSQVEYGTTTAYGQTTPLDARMVLGHVVELDGLASGSTYHFRVRSEDGFGNVEWSDDEAFETLMAAPAIADVAVTSRGVTWAVLEWTTDQSTDGWVVFGTTSSFGDSTTSPVSLATAHACTLTGLLESTEYHYSIGARNIQGAVSMSPNGTFETMQGIPMAPPELSTPSASTVNAISVIVTWTTDVPATSTIRYGVAGGDTTTIENTMLVLMHEVVISPVVPYVEYQYLVESCCPGGVATSDPCCFRTGPSTGSAVDDKEPLIVRPAIWVVGERDAAVRWSTDRACSTWVEFGRNAEYGDIVPAVSTGDCGYESYIAGLEPDTEYHFRIHAVDEAGTAVLSGDESFQTLAPPDLWPPAAPSAPACRLDNGWVELTWLVSPESDLAGYNVYRIRMSDDPAEPDRTEQLNEALIADSIFFDHEVEAGLTYAYQTTAVDSAGNESAYSASATLTLPAPPPTAVAFAQYPNPCRGDATMAFAVPGPAPADVELRVLSIDGRVVCRLADGEYPPGEHLASWDGHERSGEVAASGIYVCELRVGESIVRRKMTLLH